jgi:hypothetical protein
MVRLRGFSYFLLSQDTQRLLDDGFVPSHR